MWRQEMKQALAILAAIALLCGLATLSEAQSSSKERIARETMHYVSQGGAAVRIMMNQGFDNV